MAECSHCSENKNIVYRDYAFAVGNAKPSLPGRSILLCWGCLDVLKWKTEIKEILPNIKKCVPCNAFYLAKKQNSIKCGICWGEFYGRN